MRQQPVSGTKQWISGFFFACGFMKLEVSAGKFSDFVNSFELFIISSCFDISHSINNWFGEALIETQYLWILCRSVFRNCILF